jgi:hypothetical protein
MMLKLKFIISKKYYSMLESILRMTRELKKKGINIVNSNEDILMIHTPVAKENAEIIPDEKLFILIDRSASSDITSRTRRWLVKKNCIGILKNTILNPLDLNNEPICSNHRYFASIINKYASIETPELPEVNLAETDLQKIKCIIAHCVNWKQGFHKLAKLKNVIDKRRDIDLHFIGTTKYKVKKPDLMNWHREKAIKQAKRLKVKTLVEDHRRVSRRTFLKQLQNSKICLSPWGLGEHCWRDWEAIYCGALLVKPNSNFVSSYPEVYQNNITYVRCEPDFSDLEKVANKILDNFDDYTDMRIRARDLLISIWDQKKRANEFAETICDLYDSANHIL